MTDVPGSAVMLHRMRTAGGGGDAASPAAAWLSFAAAPAFAVMAVWTGASGSPPDMLCMATASPLNGMALMYALMSASHSGPWLTLVCRRWAGAALRR